MSGLTGRLREVGPIPLWPRCELEYPLAVKKATDTTPL